MVIWLVGNRKHLLIRQLRHRLGFRTFNIHRRKSNCPRLLLTREVFGKYYLPFQTYLMMHMGHMVQTPSSCNTSLLQGHSSMVHSTGSRIKTEDYEITISRKIRLNVNNHRLTIDWLAMASKLQHNLCCITFSFNLKKSLSQANCPIFWTFVQFIISTSHNLQVNFNIFGTGKNCMASSSLPTKFQFTYFL